MIEAFALRRVTEPDGAFDAPVARPVAVPHRVPLAPPIRRGLSVSVKDVSKSFDGRSVLPVPVPHSEKAAAEVLSLPMHPYLTEAEQAQVVAALAAAVRG